jgi:hypothetical protein
VSMRAAWSRTTTTASSWRSTKADASARFARLAVRTPHWQGAWPPTEFSWVPQLLAVCGSVWLDKQRPEVSPPRGHGCPPITALPSIVDEAIAELVLPGFHHIGVL